MKAYWKKYTLHFRRPGGTSRGVLHSKDSYFIAVEDKDHRGIGECGLLRGLSADDRPDYEEKLTWTCQQVNRPFFEVYRELEKFPSIQFGLEMAFADLKARDHILFPSDFTNNRAMQPINGLIWMGNVNFIKEQVKELLKKGFVVLKMKIGAMEVEQELKILKEIRREYTAGELELRVDANGAFSFENIFPVMDKLTRLQVHSIEQPIKRGQWQEMAELCHNPAISVALDEELIGLFSRQERSKMMETIRPQFIILKPSFIGGWYGSQEWINLAEKYRAGWWVTSALESNIGLNAIAQWNYTLNNPIPSGLGTGSLYSNNFGSPLYIEKGAIGYNPGKMWKIDLG